MIKENEDLSLSPASWKPILVMRGSDPKPRFLETYISNAGV